MCVEVHSQLLILSVCESGGLSTRNFFFILKLALGSLCARHCGSLLTVRIPSKRSEHLMSNLY